MSWKAPESYVNIIGYVVNAAVLQTSSTYRHSTLQWEYGNQTFQAEISDLLSASEYNISVYASSDEGYGVKASLIISTKLAGSLQTTLIFMTILISAVSRSGKLTATTSNRKK